MNKIATFVRQVLKSKGGHLPEGLRITAMDQRRLEGMGQLKLELKPPRVGAEK